MWEESQQGSKFLWLGIKIANKLKRSNALSIAKFMLTVGKEKPLKVPDPTWLAWADFAFLKESFVCVRCIRSDIAEEENSRVQTPGLREPCGQAEYLKLTLN